MSEYTRYLKVVDLLPFEDVITEIKRDDNFLCALEMPKEKINIYLIFQGLSTPMYFCFWKTKLLWHGTDYKPALVDDWDSLNCIVSLLSFFLVQPGDTDPDFFNDHTEKQLKFIATLEAENLRLLCNEFIYKDDYLNSEATEYFTQYFKQS